MIGKCYGEKGKEQTVEVFSTTYRGMRSIRASATQDHNGCGSVKREAEVLISKDRSFVAAEMFEDDVAIVAEVRRREAVRNGEVMEVDSAESDDEGSSDDEGGKAVTTSELIVLAEQLEAGYVSRVVADSSSEFLHLLRAFRAELHCDQLKNAKQTALDSHGFVKLA